MKKSYFLILLLFVLTVVWNIYNVIGRLEKINWLSTTATITFIGLPDGAVIGTYTDYDGKTHSDVTLYIDPFLTGYQTDTEKEIGKKIDIIYNPETGEIDRNINELFVIPIVLLFVLIAVLSSIFIRNKTKYTENANSKTRGQMKN